MALNFANNNSLSAITSLPDTISGGGLTLLQTQTASSSATISFTSGIDSTYNSYLFKFINIHPSSTDVNGESFWVNFSIDGGSNYNANKTSTFFYILNQESDSLYGPTYYNGGDLGNSSSDQIMTSELGGDNDQSVSGYLHLFDPSNTVGVKHFICQVNEARASDGSEANYLSGYINSTSAVNGVRFGMTRSGETIQSGVIKLYGVS
tara:strand:- start:2350 stop:2970 length:621 start_codon:yes stop_codon:yes gene_type:complete